MTSLGTWIVALLLLLVPVIAEARSEGDRTLGSPNASPEPAVGAERLEAATIAFKARQYNEALDLALDAWTAGGSPDALELVAVSALSGGRPFLAYYAYQRLLALPDAAPGPVSRAGRQLKSLRAQAMLVPVTTEPPGALIQVDGRTAGITPLPGPVLLFAGEHVVTAELAEHTAERRVVRIKKGTNPAIEFTLRPNAVASSAPPPPPNEDAPARAPQPASVIVSVTEASGREARLIIDGREAGALPWTGPLPVGGHEIELRSPVLRAGPVTVALPPTETFEVSIEGLPTEGVLVLNAPERASVRVDGRVLTGSPPHSTPLPVGVHRIDTALAGGPTTTQFVYLAPGATEHLTLTPPAPPDPTPALGPEPSEDDGAGAYGGLEFGFDTQLSGRREIGCKATSDCNAETSKGGALRFSAGYNFDPIGVEFQLTTLVDYSKRTRSFADSEPPGSSPLLPRNETYDYLRFAGVMGVGPRLLLGTGKVRFAAAATGGVLFRYLTLGREIKGGPEDSFVLTDSYLAPAAGFDLGVVLGRPGRTRFQLNVVVLADFPREDVETTALPKDTVDTRTSVTPFPRPAYTLASGAQVYGGIMLGFRFGH